MLCYSISLSLTTLPLSGGHVTGCVQQVTVRGAPLDVLCDMLPVFEPVEQLVCLDIKDPQEVGLLAVYSCYILLTISPTCSHSLSCCLRPLHCLQLVCMHESLLTSESNLDVSLPI